jgi:hypothetical protein
VERLLARLEAALPLPARVTPELAETRVATPAVIAGENAKISDVVPEQPVKHKSAVLSPQRLLG